MKTVLKRVQFYLVGLLAIAFAFPALAAGPSSRATTMTRLFSGVLTVERLDQKAKVLKSTRIDARYCYATPLYTVGDAREVPAEASGQYVYFVTPTMCAHSSVFGISFYGAYDRIDYVGSVLGIAYYKAVPSPDEPMVELNPNNPNYGEDVFVYDEMPLEIVVGNGEALTIYPTPDTVLPGTIVGNGYGERQAPTFCNPSGCRTTREDLGYGIRLVDKAWYVPPGTAVFNTKSELVGIVIGADKGKTAIVDWGAMMNGLYELGILERGGRG